MSKVVRVSDSAFKRLQMHAEPLVDTPGSVIDKLLDHYEIHTGPVPENSQPIHIGGQIKFDASSPPDLTHTKVLAASIDGNKLERANWNQIVYAAHARALEVTENSIHLVRATTANVAVGRKEDEGYRYLPDLEISIQGQDSNDAWDCAYNLARELNFSVEVQFKWRDRKDAAYPGEVGYMIWQPESK